MRSCIHLRHQTVVAYSIIILSVGHTPMWYHVSRLYWQQFDKCNDFSACSIIARVCYHLRHFTCSNATSRNDCLLSLRGPLNVKLYAPQLSTWLWRMHIVINYITTMLHCFFYVCLGPSHTANLLHSFLEQSRLRMQSCHPFFFHDSKNIRSQVFHHILYKCHLIAT